jgi:hypothetical protein
MELRGKFCIFIIWRHGEKAGLVGIFVILFGYAYLLWMKVKSPPVGGIYGTPGWWLYLVFVLVLLNSNLYWENIRWRYFGNFLAVSLVSWSVSMVGVLLSKNECRQGRKVFKEEIFQVVKFVAWVVYSLLFIRGVGGLMVGGGGIYLIRGWVHWRASLTSVSGKYGKSVFMDSKLAGGLLWEIYVYSLVCTEVGRDIRSWLSMINCV